jgi:hypothetical protein
MLEPDEGKLSRPVLRRGDGSNSVSLAGETERFAFAQGTITIGQRVRTIAREALQSLLKLVEQLLAQGHSCEHILEVLMPA